MLYSLRNSGYFMAKKVKQTGKNTLILLMICVVVFMAYIVYKTFGNQIVELFHLLEHGDQEELKAYLEAQSTAGGFVVLWLICVMQVVSIVFPSMVIQVAGALIYGWWRSFIVCWIGFVSGNVIAFTIGRLFKKNIATLIHKEGEKENWIIQKINQGHQIFVVAIACMVPGVPNGIIPYLSAQTTITAKEFSIAVAASSWIQVLLNCMAGHFLANGQYLFMVFAFVIEVAITLLVAKNRDKLLKAN